MAFPILTGHSVRVTNDHEVLLDREVETLWVRDSEGRLLHGRVPYGRSAPYLVGGDSTVARVVAFSTELPTSLADTLREMIEGEALATTLPWRPSTSRRCVEAIAAVTGTQPVTEEGPSYVIPAGITAPSRADVQTYDREEAEALRALIPKGDPVEGCGPWAVAVINGNVASVCSTARDGHGRRSGSLDVPGLPRQRLRRPHDGQVGQSHHRWWTHGVLQHFVRESVISAGSRTTRGTGIRVVVAPRTAALLTAARPPRIRQSVRAARAALASSREHGRDARSPGLSSSAVIRTRSGVGRQRERDEPGVLDRPSDLNGGRIVHAVPGLDALVEDDADVIGLESVDLDRVAHRCQPVDLGQHRWSLLDLVVRVPSERETTSSPGSGTVLGKRSWRGRHVTTRSPTGIAAGSRTERG